MRIKEEHIYFFIFICIIIVSFYSFIFLKPLQIKFLEVKFEVKEKVGMILDKSELNFGRVLRGSSIIKKVNMSNEYNFPIRAEILISENLRNFIFTDSEIFISGMNSSVILFKLIVPQNISEGNYSGQVKFKFYK